MMIYIKKLVTLFLIIAFVQVNGQEKLSKKEAVQLALENNYGVKISNNNVKIAENNKKIFNTGFLPTLTGNASATYNLDDTEATFANGDVTTLSGAESDRYNASVSLNYTLFDGLGRRYNYKQLKEQHNLSELQARATIENTILQLFTVYYNVAKLSEDVQLLDQNLKISKERLERVQYQFEYGQNNKLAVLNAEVDINNDSISLITAKQILLNAKRDLFVVLGRKETPSFTVDTLVTFAITPNKEELFNQLNARNTTLLQAEKNILINDFQLKANKSGYLPSIGLTGTYGWNKNNNNAASFVATSVNTGLSGGISLTWNIFDGGSTRTRVQNAKISLDSQQLQQRQIELEIIRDFNNAWEDYQNKLFVLQTQQKNVQTSTDNFNRTEEQFKLGQVTSIEFRQAQLNLINVINAKNAAKYEAKLAELQLVQLSGDLLSSEF